MVVVLDERRPRARRQQARPRGARGARRGRPHPAARCSPGDRGTSPLSIAVRGRRAGASGSSTSAARRPDRVRGAPLGLHRRRLARAAHAARAPARAARDRAAPRRGRAAARSSRRAREVEQIRELIDDVLFLSELETGRAVVSLSATPRAAGARAGRRRARASPPPARASRSASRAIPASSWRCGRGCCAWSPQNLAENAIRYAGPGSTFTLSVEARGRPRRAARRRRRDRRRRAPTCRACSSASTAPTARAPRAARGSASRSSSTSSPRRAAPSRRASARGRGLEIVCVFPAP